MLQLMLGFIKLQWCTNTNVQSLFCFCLQHFSGLGFHFLPLLLLSISSEEKEFCAPTVQCTSSWFVQCTSFLRNKNREMLKTSFYFHFFICSVDFLFKRRHRIHKCSFTFFPDWTSRFHLRHPDAVWPNLCAINARAFLKD